MINNISIFGKKILFYLKVVEDLRADTKHGLSAGEVAQRRKIHGYNEFQISEEDPLWKKYLEQVRH